MGFDLAALRDKILKFHPEIAAQGISFLVTYEAAGRRYGLRFSKAGQECGSYLAQQDADACMEGKSCVNLAVQVA